MGSLTFNDRYTALPSKVRVEFRNELLKCANISQVTFYRMKNKVDNKSAVMYIANILLNKYE